MQYPYFEDIIDMREALPASEYKRIVDYALADYYGAANMESEKAEAFSALMFCRNIKLPVQRVQYRLKKLHPYCLSNMGGVSHSNNGRLFGKIE